jgi:hypothetical protein
MAIVCCKDCKPPKRFPGCHDHCPEYLAQKAEHDRIKAEHDLKRNIDGALYSNRSDRVYKALRVREKLKK